MSIRYEKVEFDGTDGRLAARLDLPPGTPQAYALFAHCFTCTKNSLAASRIAEVLTRHDIAVLRFDFTGLGGSEGDFANTNFTSNVQDLLKAYDFMAGQYDAPALVIGHSLGGAAVLAMAGERDGIRAVVTIGAPCDPGHVKENFGDSLKEIEADGKAEVKLGSQSITITKQFLDDLESQNQIQRIEKLRKPLLVIHSPVDKIVGVDNAARIFTHAKHPKSFLSLDDADHLLTGRAHARYAGDAIAAWASRYTGLSLHPDMPETSLKGKDATLVTEAGTGKFTHIVDSAGHRLIADEPLSYGGDNRGPSPYDFLSIGLGACTGMTIRLYAEHKGIGLERVAVSVTHDKVHASDCDDCETKDNKVDTFTREIELTGDLSDEEREKLMKIADKCPVHRTMHAEIKVRTKEAG